MTAEPDPSVPRPDPGHGHHIRERLPIPPVKRRHKKGSGSDGETAPGPATDGSDSADAADLDDPLLAEIDELSARVQALKVKRLSSQRVVMENRGAKYHRLARRHHPSAPEGHDPDASAPSTAGPVTLPAPSAVRYTPWHETSWRPGWLFGTVCVLAVGILAFYLGQSSVQPAKLSREAGPAPEPKWTADQIGQLDGLFAADRAGNPGIAFRQATQLSGQLGGREGLSLQTAVWRARSGDLNQAESELVQLENSAPTPLLGSLVQDRLGFISARRRDFQTAVASFAAAATANPFDPLIFYHWGESLRRSGQLVEAMSKFQLALQRLPAEQPESYSLRECAALRLRLTQIELGNDGDLKPFLEEHMRQPQPGVYWLLTQVAYSLQHNDRSGAVVALQRARAGVPPEQFESLTNDYFLRQLAFHKPELAELAPEMTPARHARLDASTAYFVDP